MRRISEDQINQPKLLSGTAARDGSHGIDTTNKPAEQLSFPTLSSAKSFFNTVKRRLSQSFLGNAKPTDLSLDEVRDWYRLGQVYQHTISDIYEPDQYIVQCCTSEEDRTLLERAKNWHPFIAILENKVENMEVLLKRKEDLEPKFDVNAARDRLGRTCLHLAAARNRDQIAALLIEHDADIYVCGPGGATPYGTEPIQDSEREKLPKEATIALTSMILPISCITIAAKSEELSAFQSQEGILHFYGRRNWPTLKTVSPNFIIYIKRPDTIHPLLRKTPDELSKHLCEILLLPEKSIQVVIELIPKDLNNVATMSLTLDEAIEKGIAQERLVNRVRRIIAESNLTSLHKLSEFNTKSLAELSLAQKLGFIQLNRVYEEVIGGQEYRDDDQDRVYALLNKEEQHLIRLSQQWNIHFLARTASQDALDLLQEIIVLNNTQQLSINLNEISRYDHTCLEKALTIMPGQKPNGKVCVVLLKHGARSCDLQTLKPVLENNDDDMEDSEELDNSYLNENAYGSTSFQHVAHTPFALVKGQTKSRDKQSTFLYSNRDVSFQNRKKRQKNRQLFNQFNQGGSMQGKLPVSVQSFSPSQGQPGALLPVTNFNNELQQLCEPVRDALVKIDRGTVSVPGNYSFGKVVEVCKGKDAKEIDQPTLIQQLASLPQLRNGDVVEIDGVKLTVLQYCAYKGLHQVANYILRDFPENKKTITRGLHPNHIALLNLQKHYISSHLQQTQRFHEVELPSGVKINDLHLALYIHNFPLASICTQHVVITSPIMSYGVGTLVHFATAFATGIKLPQLLLHYPYKDGTSLRTILNTKDQLGRTPLGCAAELGHLRQVQFYLRLFSYDLMLQSELEEIPRAFYQAAIAGQVEVVRYFLDTGFTPSNLHRDYNRTISIISQSTNDDQQSVYGLIDEANRQIGLTRYEKPNPKTQEYDAYVYEGGGMKGVIFPYAREAVIRCCQKRAADEIKRKGFSDVKDQRLLATEAKRVAGTSAGSIFAFLDAMAVPDDVVRREMTRDFSEFLEDRSHLAETLLNDGPLLEKVKEMLKALGIRVEKIMSIVEQAQTGQAAATTTFSSVTSAASTAANVVWNGRTLYNEFQEAVKDIKKLDKQFTGFVSGNKITEWLAKLITDQKILVDMTFGEWGDMVNDVKVRNREGRYKHFCLVTTCIETGEPILLSSELPSSRNYVILRAIRASMAIPIVFEPVPLQIKTGSTFSETKEHHWDGGLLCNYLITQYSKKFYTDPSAVGASDFPTFNAKTLGLRLKFKNPTLAANATFKEQLVHLAKIFWFAENILGKFYDRDYGRSIELEIGNTEAPAEGLGTLSFRTLGADDIKLLTRNAREAVCGYYGYKVEEVFPEEPRMVHSIEVLNSGNIGLHPPAPPSSAASSKENPAPQGPDRPNS